MKRRIANIVPPKDFNFKPMWIGDKVEVEPDQHGHIKSVTYSSVRISILVELENGDQISTEANKVTKIS